MDSLNSKKLRWILDSSSKSSSDSKSSDEKILSTTIDSKEINSKSQKRHNILIGITASVATIKIVELIEQFLKQNFLVVIISTKLALNFVDSKSIKVPIFTDDDEYSLWKTRGDPVLHIELRRWADVFLIAPLSANTLSKLANGICDNLLTCVCRAWNFSKPFLVAPAMNTFMWEHPFTKEHIERLEKIGIQIISPISKRLICEDNGMGAMEEIAEISSRVEQIFKNSD